MQTTARVTVPIVLVVSISLFLQGHNLPGGGFIGGVLTTAAFVLIYVAYDLDYLESGVLGREVEPGTSVFEHRTVTAYRRTLLAGLVVVLGSGFAGMLIGDPFLTQGTSTSKASRFTTRSNSRARSCSIWACTSSSSAAS